MSRICGFSFRVRKAIIGGKRLSKAVVEEVTVYSAAFSFFLAEVTPYSAAFPVLQGSHILQSFRSLEQR